MEKVASGQGLPQSASQTAPSRRTTKERAPFVTPSVCFADSSLEEDNKRKSAFCHSLSLLRRQLPRGGRQKKQRLLSLPQSASQTAPSRRATKETAPFVTPSVCFADSSLEEGAGKAPSSRGLSSKMTGGVPVRGATRSGEAARYQFFLGDTSLSLRERSRIFRTTNNRQRPDRPLPVS
jgi:hypothetical protein